MNVKVHLKFKCKKKTGNTPTTHMFLSEANLRLHSNYIEFLPRIGYYGSGGTYPYQAYGVGDGTWSNGTDPMTFLSGYPHDSYSMDGMWIFIMWL